MKIDLSPKNIAKTIMYDNLLAQDLKTNKRYIGVLTADKDCKRVKIIPEIYTLQEFKKEFKNRKVLSTHEYQRYLSVIIERLMN